MKNLCSENLIAIFLTLGEHVYSVGSTLFPAMEANEEMLMKIFQDLDLEIIRWELCVKMTTHYYCILKKRAVS